MTNNERQRKFAENQKKIGRSQKIFWLTNAEWEKVKIFIKEVLRPDEPG